MIDREHHNFKYKNEAESHLLFCMRMLFKHIDLFHLWQQQNNRSAKDLYPLTLELLDEIKRLDNNIDIIAYKKAILNKNQIPNARLSSFALNDLKKKLVTPSSTPIDFYLYLYYLHKNLFKALVNKGEASHEDALALYYITNKIIEEYERLDSSISTSSYKREIAKLKEMFQ